MTDEPTPALPGARLTLVTTPQVVERLAELLRTGCFGRSLPEAAERILVRGLEDAMATFPPVEAEPSRAYQCRICRHQWLAIFDGPPDPTTEYALECPACGKLAGEPIAVEES